MNNAHGLAMETRLDKMVEPTAYKLELEPYLEDGVFKGHVSINLTWVEETDEVALHADHELEITNTLLRVRPTLDLYAHLHLLYTTRIY